MVNFSEQHVPLSQCPAGVRQRLPCRDLGLFAIGDVDGRSKKAAEFTGRRVEGAARVDEPPELPVVPQEAVVEGKFTPPIERRREDG